MFRTSFIHILLNSCAVQSINKVSTRNFICYIRKCTNRVVNTKHNPTINLVKYLKYQLGIDDKDQWKFPTENHYGHQILESLPQYKNTLSTFLTDFNPVRLELHKNWKLESASNIVSGFESACQLARNDGLTISDERFDTLVDGLMDKCEDLTNDELRRLLTVMKRFPGTDVLTNHNYHDIWSALDDICLRRLPAMSIDEMLLFADYFYELGLSRSCDFTIECIKRLCRKVKTLNAQQLIQGLFYINVCRKQWGMIEFEFQLEKYINDMTLDELAIVSMSFFKTETTIKAIFLLDVMLDKLLKETSTVNEITLSAILKIIRYSHHIPLTDKLEHLLTQLVPEIGRLSTLSCVHVALTGTNAQLFHPQILEAISQKFVDNISQVRLKDMERIVFALGLFNFKPDTTPCIFECVKNELLNPARAEEIQKFPRCLTACVHYLGLKGMYLYSIIDEVLDMSFLSKAYGNNTRNIGREILFLDASLDIDCPDYQGNRLSPALRKKITKWTTHWIPTRNQVQRLSAADKIFLDLLETVHVVQGGTDYVHVNHILPHFQRADIIICNDKNGNPVEVRHFDRYSLGDVMRPELRDGLKWYAFVVGGWNMLIRNTPNPVGTLHTKLRQLEKIGFVPVMVPWYEFQHLKPREKENYISDRIK